VRDRRRLATAALDTPDRDRLIRRPLRRATPELQMYLFDTRTLSPPVGEPSTLLEHLAGAFAPRVAGLWRAPHAAFLTATAERRHLICLALAMAGEHALPAEANALLELPMKRAIRAFVPEAPAGLLRALGRLGETAWSADDYRSLLRLLDFGVSMKILRHADTIGADDVRSLALLPDPLLAAGFGRLKLTPEQAAMAREAFHRTAALHGSAAATSAASRWALADNLPALFRAIQLDLLPEIQPPPFPGTERLKALRSKAEMAEAADRFHNCLRTRIRHAALGCAAYYEWTGSPGAIVEIWHDHLFGWRLDEAKGPKNATLPRPVRDAINAELRAMGVHVGLRGWEFEDAVARAGRPNFRRPDEAETIDDIYGD
jgi:hypothetical protein